jgi:hypothetical protein
MGQFFLGLTDKHLGDTLEGLEATIGETHVETPFGRLA